MVSPANARALRLNLVDLLRQPGTERTISLDITHEELGCALSAAQATILSPLVVNLRATSSTDSVEVVGSIVANWNGECRRCLRSVDGVSEMRFDERFVPAASSLGIFDEADITRVEADYIDLVPPVREIVMIDIPDAVLCAQECQGICGICGADRNAHRCDCIIEDTDDRWAALKDLRLEE